MIRRIGAVISQNAAGSAGGFEGVVADKQRQAGRGNPEIVDDGLRLSVEEVDVHFSDSRTRPGHGCPTATADVDGLKGGGREVQQYMIVLRNRRYGGPEVCPLVGIFVLG